MFKRIKVILVLISLSITLCLMSNTYSRYVADMRGKVDIPFAKWQILINNTDITQGETSSIDFTPNIISDDNIASNTIAPSSKGYFDIAIDSSNVDVSFKYTINLSVTNPNMPDLLISEYGILDETHNEDTIVKTPIINNVITNNLLYNNKISNFRFKPFTVRVYFEWYEGDNEQMNDESDTTFGTSVTNDTLTLNANIVFEQIINTPTPQVPLAENTESNQIETNNDEQTEPNNEQLIE